MCALLSSKLKQHAPEALPWGNRNQKLNDKISVTKKIFKHPSLSTLCLSTLSSLPLKDEEQVKLLQQCL